MNSFRLITNAILSGCTGVLASGSLLSAPGDTGTRFAESLRAEVHRRLVAGQFPGAAVAVLQEGKPLLLYGAGFRRIEDRAAVHPDRTLFPIDAISNLLVWVAVSGCIDSGRLAWQDELPIPLFSPPEQPVWGPLNLDQVARYSSGFEDVSFAHRVRRGDASPPLREFLALHTSRRVRPAGIDRGYSAYAVSLAALAVQRCRERSFEEVVETEIVQRLALNHVVYPSPTAKESVTIVNPSMERAEGHFRRAGRFVAVERSFSRFRAAEGAEASALDLARLLDAAIRTPQRLGLSPSGGRRFVDIQRRDESFSGVSGGLIEMRALAPRVIGLRGESPGFQSVALWFPEHRIVCVLLLNASTSPAPFEIIDSVLNQIWVPALPPALSFDPALYQGYFASGHQAAGEPTRFLAIIHSIRVAAGSDGGFLIYEGLNGTAQRYVAIGEGLFQAEHGARRILFLPGAGGVSNRLVLSDRPEETYNRLLWYESPSVVIASVVSSLLVLLLSLFLPPTGFLQRPAQFAPLAALAARWIGRALGSTAWRHLSTCKTRPCSRRRRFCSAFYRG